MARLSPDEMSALRQAAQATPPLQPHLPPLPAIDFLRLLSHLPPSLRPPKPVRFEGHSWKL